ncbi:hypothetical protein [Magnetovibrio sp.]|uniref:hypothetical protein n=1 Tax=Magnetovibrio sp. TaxID=2024836 RepID=UPI002F9342B8
MALQWKEARKVCVDYQVVIDEAYMDCDQATYDHKILDLSGELENTLELPLGSIEAIRFDPYHNAIAFRIATVWYGIDGDVSEVQVMARRGYLN